MQWIEHLYQQCAQAHAQLDIAFPEFEAFWQRGFVEIPQLGKWLTTFDLMVGRAGFEPATN